jgi:peptide/nickel transport system permease protein
MRNFIVKKTLSSLLVFIFIIIIIFFINVNLPGNITNSQEYFFQSKEVKAALRKKLHLDEPKTVQLKFWAQGLFNGTLGYSYASGAPVTQVAKLPLLNTIRLSLTSFILSLIIAIPFGVLSSTKQYSLWDYLLTAITLIGISVPSFFFASLFKGAFLFNNKVFDFFAKQKILEFKEYQRMMSQDILPFVILTMVNLATLSRYARSSMLEVVKQDYIRTAMAKGLKYRKVYYKHALKNALIILLTVIGFIIPTLLTSTFFIEIVLGFRGIGSLFFNSIYRRDYGLAMGLSIILSGVTVFCNYIVDIAYGFIDPRIRYVN